MLPKGNSDMHNHLFLLFFFLMSFAVSAQRNIKDSVVFAPLMSVSYAFQIPGEDLAKNYGYNSNLGLNFLVKTKKNILYGAEGNFLFGNQVKDSTVLDNLKTSQGWIIDRDGKPAEVLFYERGYSLFFKAGKVIPIPRISPNPNSGMTFLSGVGFLQHKMRIEITGNTVPELTREYREGYDRLSNGLAFSQFAGYQHLSNKQLVNFFGGVECIAAFTKNRRGYNYDTRAADNRKRLDLLYGIKVGWVIPLYKKMPKEFYFY